MNKPITEKELQSLEKLITMAREEDFGTGDITAELFPSEVKVKTCFVARSELVFCGRRVLERIAAVYDQSIVVSDLINDGDLVQAGDILGTWEGPVRGITSAERVALNFVQRLSGIATMTKQYVDRVAGSNVDILDTRKTTPGWRDLEKYAVRAGGGVNHRRGLYDAAMVKDNHLASLARETGRNSLEVLAERLGEIRTHIGPEGFVELEVDTLEQLEQSIMLPVDIILLDNMGPEKLRQAIEIRRKAGREEVQFEASGSITMEGLEEIAKTGVERISIGALTHSARAVDIGLDMADA